MARSVHKGPYIDANLREKLEKWKALAPAEKEKMAIRTYSRDSVITPDMIGANISVHNGKVFTPLKIRDEMVGHRLGEFAPTRKFVRHGGKLQKEVEARQGAPAAAAPAATPQPAAKK